MVFGVSVSSLGTVIDEIYTKEQVFEMIERALLLYREQGKTGERFGVFIRKSGPPAGCEAPDRNPVVYTIDGYAGVNPYLLPVL